MSVECPAGYSPDPDNKMPSKPSDSITVKNNSTYVRLKCEWKRADNSVALSCGCGQQCVFTMNCSYTTEGNVSVSVGGSGGGVGAGTTKGNEISINVGSKEYEYIGYPMVLEETKETGTVTISGGFVKGGLWSKIKFAWRFAKYGLAALLPNMIYNPPDEIETRELYAAWKICRKPCSEINKDAKKSKYLEKEPCS
jgi:hypothetical protein